MDADLLIPATAALLDGWIGPGVLTSPWGDLTHRCAVIIGRAWEDGRRTVESVDPDTRAYEAGAPVERLSLDLSRAECRDRVARVIAAARWPGEDLVASSAPRWFCGWLRTQPQWVMETEVVRHAPDGRRYGGCVHADWDLALDPRDDTRLPDGSRRVDALALAIVAREVLRG